VKTGKESEETVVAITSQTPQSEAKANARQLLEIVRGHWTIENGSHYVRDRSYDEDRCQVRNPNAARILATFRSLARFMAKTGWHKPKTQAKKTTPAFNRYCNAHQTLAIRWLTTEP